MRRFAAYTEYLPPWILALSLLVVYLGTLAPGLTWANFGSDGGDLIAASATGGVAHPTGYPVYLLLARVFQMLPIGSLAYRTNLMSALAATLAAGLVYSLSIRSLLLFKGRPNWLAGLASAYAFGLAPLLWSQAVITEVYALHALFVVLLLYLSSDYLPAFFTPKRRDSLLGLIFGLSLGNHLTTVLLLPLLFSSIILKPDASTRRWGLDKGSLSWRFAWLGVGLLVYLILPLRALSSPPVNWGNPVTLDGFGWLVSGQLYQDQLFVLTPALALERMRGAAGLLLNQFGVVGLLVGLIGLIVFFKPSRLMGNTVWIVAAFSVFAIGYATNDSFLYLIPAFLGFAIWIGMGLAGLMEMSVKWNPKIGWGIGSIFLLYLFVQAGVHWPQVDASHDLRAEQFGMQVLAQAPEQAILFAKGDQAIFSMWYFQYALHKRPDLAIVATDLLRFDWYQETLHSTYPDLALPGPFPFAETMAAANPEHPVCFIEYDQSAEINCLPANSYSSP